jgi:hypothetical protein
MKQIARVSVRGLVVLLCLACARTALAAVTYESWLNSLIYQQSTDNATPAFTLGYANPVIQTNSVNDGTSASITTPNTTTYPLGGSQSNWQTLISVTPSTLAASFPNGNYAFTLSGGVSGNISSSFDMETSQPAVPELTGTTLTDLHNDAVNTPTTITLNGFTADPSANSYMIVTIDRGSASGSSVYAFGMIPASTTSITLPAKKLSANSGYVVQVQYYNVYGFASSLAGAPDVLTADITETDASFISGPVPEPACLGGVFCAGAALLARRRGTAFKKRKGAAH